MREVNKTRQYVLVQREEVRPHGLASNLDEDDSRAGVINVFAYNIKQHVLLPCNRYVWSHL